MKISVDAIRSFNNRNELTFNDDWNKAQNLGTRAERKFLGSVAGYFYLEKITHKNIKHYIKLKQK